MFFIFLLYLACHAFEEQEQMCQNSTLVPAGRLRLDLVSQFVHKYLQGIKMISVKSKRGIFGEKLCYQLVKEILHPIGKKIRVTNDSFIQTMFVERLEFPLLEIVQCKNQQ